MDDTIRQERCAQVAAAIIALMPTLLEGKSRPNRLQDALEPLSRIRAVADAGSSGISNDDYLRWLGVAPENLGRIETAVRDGDADGAFAAFRDPENGLHLLVQGCQGCQGW